MRSDDVFPSKYLKPSDMPLTATIDRVEMELVGKERERRAVLYLHGSDKALVLNKVNFNTLEKITGQPDTEKWTGASVTLYAARTMFAGEEVDCTRIKAAPPTGPTKATRKPPAKPVQPGLATATGTAGPLGKPVLDDDDTDDDDPPPF